MLASPARPATQAVPARSGSPVAIGGMEAEEAQDAQIVLGDARAGIADEAHAARFEIGKPADVVVHRAVGIDRQRVDGEVAPLRVALPVAAERAPWRGGRRSRRPRAASSPRTAAPSMTTVTVPWSMPVGTP